MGHIDRLRRVAGVVARPLAVLALLLLFSVPAAVAQRGGIRPALPAPEQSLGQANDQPIQWDKFLAYYRQLDQLSDRLQTIEIGRSTLNRPLVALAISSPGNLGRLDALKEIQRQLSDPRQLGPGNQTAVEDLIRRGKVIVVLTGSPHAAREGGTMMATALAHRLLSDNSPEVARILDRVVLFLIPSLNPDGIEGAGDWRRRMAGTPAEGAKPPLESPGHYVEDDLDYDWSSFTQVETRQLGDKLLSQWRPQIWRDLRGSDEAAPRSLPRPFLVPWESGFKPTVASEVNSLETALALLDQAALQHEQYLRAFYTAGRRAMEAKDPPYAYLLPEPEIPKSLREAFQKLEAGLKKVTGTEEEKHEKSEALVDAATQGPSSSEEVSYYFKTEGIDRLLAILKRGGIEVLRAAQPFTAEGRKYPAGAHIVPMRQPYAAYARSLLEPRRSPQARRSPGNRSARLNDAPLAHTLPLLLNVQAIPVSKPFQVEAYPEPSALIIQSRVRSNGGVRVGLYRSSWPSTDEGWTRWIFDQYKFGYGSLTDAEARVGNLKDRYDAIILPDQPPATLKEGPPGVAGDNRGVERGYAAGLGDAGIRALREFVGAGGTLIAFNRAAVFAIEQFDLPVRNVLKGIPANKFQCPGAILRLRVETANRLSFGVEAQSIAWFENGPAFEVTDAARARVIARYPSVGSLLLSGELLGEHWLRGRAALVEASFGKGRVILFGFRPQYRGLSLTTYPFVFNALLTSRF